MSSPPKPSYSWSKYHENRPKTPSPGPLITEWVGDGKWHSVSIGVRDETIGSNYTHERLAFLLANPTKGDARLYLWKRQDTKGSRSLIITETNERPVNDGEGTNAILITDVSKEGIFEVAQRKNFFVDSKSPEIFTMDESRRSEESTDKELMGRRDFMQGAEEP